MAEPFDVSADPSQGLTLTPSPSMDDTQTAPAQMPPEAVLANTAPVVGPAPVAPIPRVVPPPPPLTNDPHSQLAALIALGMAIGQGPRGGGAGALEGFAQSQAIRQQQQQQQYRLDQQLATQQNAKDQQDYKIATIQHAQDESRLRQFLGSVSRQVQQAKTPQQYDALIAGFGNMLRGAGYTRLTDDWLRSAVPFVKPSEQQTATDAFNAWRKNPSNQRLLDENPALAAQSMVQVDLNGDGVKENVPLSVLADRAGMGFAQTANGIVTVPKQQAGGTSPFDVKYTALLQKFKADNRRDPTPDENNKLVDQAIVASKERPPSVSVGMGGIDPGSIADAIVSGEQPPDLKGLYRYGAAVRSELAKRHYDLSTASLDWQATQKFIATANGQQQTRMRQAIDNAYHSLDVIDNLADQWKAGRFPTLNHARLLAAQQGVLGPDAQRIATQLDAQIADVTSELANTYMGGNSPTDHALDLAKKNLSSDWSEMQLRALTAQARQNLQIRQNSMRNVEAVTPSGNNPYVPPTEAAPKTATGTPDLTGLGRGQKRTFKQGPFAGQSWTIGPDGKPKQVG